MRRLIVAGAMALILLAGAPAISGAAEPTRDVCANRLCTEDKPGTQSCRTLFSRYDRISRCFITRAAVHFHQPRSLALYIAHRESRYQWWIVNAYGYAGLYQFGTRLWSKTPYRGYSRLAPRWAALAAMRTWAHGGYHHWTCC